MTTFGLSLLWFLTYAMERLAEVLNLQTAEKPLPEELAPLQSPDEHQKAYNYLRENTRLGFVRETLLTFGFIGLLAWGGFGWFAAVAERLAPSPFWIGLAFAFLIIFVQSIATLPFSIYSTFSIEERFGFNRTTPKTFVGDLIKGTLVGGILTAILYAFALWVIQTLGDRAWLYVWAGYVAFQLFIVWLAPVTILPLFLKLTPLPEGELKSAIEAYAQKQQFKLDGAWVCDASKRSAKSNAFFTGFGKFRRLVLFDTLIAKHPVGEIVSVVAHEAGHFKLGHILRMTVFSAVMSLAFLWGIHQLINLASLYLAFGIFPPEQGIGLVLALFVLGRAMSVFGFVSSWMSRKHEYEADAFAVKTAKDPEALISGLTRLTRDNLAVLVLHPFYVALNSSHPPLVQRMAAIRALPKT